MGKRQASFFFRRHGDEPHPVFAARPQLLRHGSCERLSLRLRRVRAIAAMMATSRTTAAISKA